MLHIYAAVAEQERTKISERTKAALAAAKARGVKLGNPHGPKPFTAEMRQQGAEAQRQQANARAQQLSEILAEFAGESANATAKALNERGLPSARGGKWTARSVINVCARLFHIAHDDRAAGNAQLVPDPCASYPISWFSGDGVTADRPSMAYVVRRAR